MKCEDCKYWERYSDEEQTIMGHCRKHLFIRAFLISDSYKKIQANAEDVGMEAVWPTTTNCEWCSEFQPKEGKDNE